MHPLPAGVVESLIKRKDLLEWEANIEESNVKGNELHKIILKELAETEVD